MAAGADKTVRILNEHQLPWADLPGPAAEDQQRLLGPPLRDPETGMALLEFDCGPARAAPVVQQPALLLDHMAPLPELPAVDGIYSSAAFVPADSVRHIALRARLQCQAAYNLSWQADSACARVFSVSDAWFNSNFLSCVSCSRHRPNSGSTTRAGNPTRNTTITRKVHHPDMGQSWSPPPSQVGVSIPQVEVANASSAISPGSLSRRSIPLQHAARCGPPISSW